MAAPKESLALIRAVIQELRRNLPQKPVRSTLAARYLLSEARKHQTTEKRLCRAHQELQAKMDTYCTYLASSRKAKALHLQYHARGERSVEESAHLVGLSVPKPFDNSQDR
ncbi:protein FMC1 homolog isoform X2 [Dermacentor silvarum]|uniref:protein FMC1 homolog isoform X2 n=1 Tax=Dermacentor silvarum TaxID=543639 RepID=UPI00189850AF|nr:protein FMC1 homolog isoform X2 [Dermacentor silvarum]